MREQIGALQLSFFDVIENEAMTENQFIDACLCRGSGFVDGKYRIHRYITLNKRMNEFPKWLSNEYGTGGSFMGGEDIEYSPKGWSCRSSEYEYNVSLSWNDVAERIVKLDLLNRYYTEKDEKSHQQHLDFCLESFNKGSYPFLSDKNVVLARAGDKSAFESFHYL